MSETTNRAFMYGESVFTTMRIEKGQILSWEYHFERLKQGVEFVYGPFLEEANWSELLLKMLNNHLPDGTDSLIIRLAVYFEQGRGLIRKGPYSVKDLKIASSFSTYDPHEFEGKSLQLRTCLAPQKPDWWPDFLKAGSYLETILLQKMHLKPGDDDLLFLTSDNKVLEASVANIFIISQNQILTPPAGPQVLAGVTRRKVIELSDTVFGECREYEFSFDQMLKAEGIFGTNSIRGPFLIDRIDSYNIHYSSEFLEKFNSMRQRVLS